MTPEGRRDSARIGGRCRFSLRRNAEKMENRRHGGAWGTVIIACTFPPLSSVLRVKRKQ